MYKNDVNYFGRAFSILIAITTSRSLNSGSLLCTENLKAKRALLSLSLDGWLSCEYIEQ